MSNEKEVLQLSPLITPNLPISAVRAVVMAGDNKSLSDALKRLDIDVLHTSTNIFLEDYVSNHADMLVFHMGGSEILLSSEQVDLHERLKKLEFTAIYLEALIKSPYPNDVLLNAVILGECLICNMKTAANEVIQAAKARNLKIINVKQGYTKCSICLISNNAIITEDIGINQECIKWGIDVLLISKGSVKLKNHQYGFLGGCCGLIDKNKLAFTGNIKTHTDYKIINKFLMKYDITPVTLANDELIDIGGILPIMQNRAYNCNKGSK